MPDILKIAVTYWLQVTGFCHLCRFRLCTWSVLDKWISMVLRSAVGMTHDLRLVCGQTCDGLYHFAFYFHILPTCLHGLCFGFCFAGPLPLCSLLHGPLSRVNFGESLVVRLHSEIDHIHLSSEAQCVSHLYPQVDCHIWDELTWQFNSGCI